MSDPLDELLQRAAGDSPPDVTPGLVEKITASIAGSLAPVRPLPPLGYHAALLVAACAVVAGIGAKFLGLGGVHKLTGPAAAAIFSVLAVLLAFIAVAGAAVVRPGTRRPMSSGRLLSAVCGAVLVLFAAIFVHYGWVRFFPQGLACLKAGLIHAALAAVLIGIALRRCYALDPKAAGTVIGTLAGFAGVIMLELHCTDFQAQHVLVWHTAVLPCSALLGRLAGAFISRSSSR